MSESRPQVTPERIFQLAFGYGPPLILEAAVRHRVFDILDAGPATAEEVSVASDASPRGIRMVMNALVGLEFLSKDADGRYALTPESAAFLVSGKPGYFGGLIRHTSEQLIPKWLRLNEVVRTGRPGSGGAVNQEATGALFFHEFVEALFPMSYPAAQALGDVLGLGESRAPTAVLDLAAGSGVWSIALAHKSPHVRVTAVDWAGVLDVTRRVAERNGVADRYRFVPGDLLEVDFGSGYQIATLGHILHSEGEARSRILLRRVWEALAPGGTIAIAEMLTNDQRTGPAHALMFAVNMLVNTDEGDTFSFGEIGAWLGEAGFVEPRTVDTPGPSPLILAAKPA
jgi:2-polyprenyl-3-methyl-5-hydroxy-6-metoxy-1,4-benzoquinol methylase